MSHKPPRVNHVGKRNARPDVMSVKVSGGFKQKPGGRSGRVEVIARGNHIEGYRGVIQCEHRHATTIEARSCVMEAQAS